MALIVAAIIVWMINWMYRMSVESNREREVEEAAREYFDRHGRWPEEPARERAHPPPHSAAGDAHRRRSRSR